MKPKYTEARKECNRRWDSANLDRMSLAVRKGGRDAIKAHAASMGESMNRFINRAIKETMKRDKGATSTAELPQKQEKATASSENNVPQGAKKAAGEYLSGFFRRALANSCEDF